MSNTRRLRVIACASGWLALALIACGPSDPLQPIRAKQEAGDFEATIEPLRDLLADHPDDAEANYLYGRALVSTDHAGLASWALRRAMKDPAWEIAAGLQLATASLSVGDYNEAVEIATRVLEREPENVPA